MIRTRKTNKADIRFVMKNLSAVSADELVHAEVSNDQATRMFIESLRHSEVITILDRAEPIAVLAFNEIEPMNFSTMFMATEKFFGGRSRPSLYLRRMLDEMLASSPGMMLRSETYSNHPELHRWYRLMAYETGQSDGNRTFFVRRG